MLDLLREYLGSIGVVLFFVVYKAVETLNKRSAARTRTATAEITAAGKRDDHALEAEKEAAAYLRESLADARTEIRTLRVDLATERAALDECKDKVVDVTTLHRSGMAAFKLRIEYLERQVEDASGRESELKFRIRHAHARANEWRAMLGLEPLAPLPAWIREDDDERGVRAIGPGEPPSSA